MTMKLNIRLIQANLQRFKRQDRRKKRREGK